MKALMLVAFLFWVLTNGYQEVGPFRTSSDCYDYKSYYGMWSYSCEIRS